MNLTDLLRQAQQARQLRPSTVASYRKLLERLGIGDDSLNQAELEYRLLNIENPNTRRACVTAIRAVLGIPIKYPPGYARKYNLPSESQLRFALMYTKYEVRGLLMMYAGLRLGEACAVTSQQLKGDKLLIDRQVLEYFTEGQNHVSISPTKTAAAYVLVPRWLCALIAGINDTDIPGNVRTALWQQSRRHKIEMNPSALRHWHATWLLNNGVNIVAVSRQLRHSDPAITMRTYIDVADEDIRGVLNDD